MFAQGMVVRSVWLAVWGRDGWLVAKLIEEAPEAARWLCIEGGSPVLAAGVAFAKRFEHCRFEELRKERVEAEGMGSRGRRRRRAIERMAALWSPQQRRLRVVGVQPEVDAQMGDAEGHADESMASALRRHCRSWLEQRLAMDGPGPDWRSIGRAAEKARDSAPGPDGLRYTAWRVAGAIARRCLADLLWCFMGGGPLLASFAATLVVFLPKGDEPGYLEDVILRASCLRPLGLQNADANLVQHVVNGCLLPHVSEHTHNAQHGFVRVRNLLRNIVEVDTEARI